MRLHNINTHKNPQIQNLHLHIPKSKVFVYIPFSDSSKHGPRHTGTRQLRPGVSEASGGDVARLFIDTGGALCEASEQSVEEASNETEIEAIAAIGVAIAAGPAEEVSEEHKQYGDHSDAQDEEEEPQRRRNGRGVGRRRSMAEGDLDGR